MNKNIAISTVAVGLTLVAGTAFANHGVDYGEFTACTLDDKKATVAFEVAGIVTSDIEIEPTIQAMWDRVVNPHTAYQLMNDGYDRNLVVEARNAAHKALALKPQEDDSGQRQDDIGIFNISEITISDGPCP